MVRTISQIAGDVGLAQNATRNVFEESEKSVLDTIKKTMGELRSTDLERFTSQGLGRSSFLEGIQGKKEADILGQVGSQFAQQRAGLESSAILSGLQSDISKDLLKFQQGLSTEQDLLGLLTSTLLGKKPEGGSIFGDIAGFAVSPFKGLFGR